jgi:hypothetical protein
MAEHAMTHVLARSERSDGVWKASPQRGN